MDDHRRHRGGRSRPGAVFGPLLPICLSGSRPLRQPGAVGHAEAIRRARREAGSMSSGGSMKGQVPEDAVLMLFGATGDLAKRKLLPGLFHLDVAGLMPKRYRIVGSAPAGTGADAESFGTYVHDVLKQFGRKDVTDQAWESFG